MLFLTGLIFTNGEDKNTFMGAWQFPPRVNYYFFRLVNHWIKQQKTPSRGLSPPLAVSHRRDHGDKHWEAESVQGCYCFCINHSSLFDFFLCNNWSKIDMRYLFQGYVTVTWYFCTFQNGLRKCSHHLSPYELLHDHRPHASTVGCHPCDVFIL